ncbi:TPA: site-specific DNA-methyltransferase [Pseudomonas aeruginosa]|nr:site-specific DNA-methyltransferase [Pseudomonas aeruginosa]
MHSPNLTQDNIARIRDLFPGCVTEARGEDGSVKLAVDFDQLRQELSSSIVEGPQERYHLNWPGKREALLTANAPIAKTLRPVREESVDFDTTKNLFIEGDNLDALKLLQETYLGKVKMIYIDPPYNTGNDFIYEDDFSEDYERYLLRSNQVDAAKNRLVVNPESSGRHHSDWLDMIYARIRLARNLLSDEGVIFISIDDNEHANIKKICDEVFGEQNFITNFVWKRKAGGGDDSGQVATEHEYVVCYGRDVSKTQLANIKHESPAMTAKYNRSENGRRYYLERLDKTSLTYSESMDFPIECPDGSFVSPLQPDANNPTTAWRWGKKTVLERRSELEFLKDEKTGQWRVYTRTWESLDGVTPRSLLVEKEHGRNRDGTQELSNLLGPKIFSNPKPTKLLTHLIKIGASAEDSIVLDFFAGSGSLAHAVMLANAEDGVSRRVICIQIPAVTERDDYVTIAEICKERIRRAGKESLSGKCRESWNKDIGFRVLKIDTSNMSDVYYAPDALDKTNLDLFVDNIKPDRTPEDLLFQVMLDWGVDLALPIEKRTIQGKDVFFVDGDALAACFDAHGGIDEAFVKELATHKPLRVVFRDAGFKDSAVKINVEQIFKLLSPSTEVKSI